MKQYLRTMRGVGAFVTALILTFTLAPGAAGMTAKAAAATRISIWDGDKTYFIDNGTADAELAQMGVSYDSATNTLILQDCTLTNTSDNGTGIYAYGDLNLVLKGENRFRCKAAGLSVYGNLTIAGDGSLEVISTGSSAIDVMNGNLVVDGATVTAENAGHLSAMNVQNGSITIQNGAAVNVTTESTVANYSAVNAIHAKETIEITGNSEVSAKSKEGDGIYSGGSILISGSQVNAVSNKAAGNGIYAFFGNITIEDHSTVSASATGTNGRNGIYAENGNVTITDSAVTATAENAAYANGIHAASALVIDGASKITVSAGQAALWGNTSVKLAGQANIDVSAKGGPTIYSAGTQADGAIILSDDVRAFVKSVTGMALYAPNSSVVMTGGILRASGGTDTRGPVATRAIDLSKYQGTYAAQAGYNRDGSDLESYDPKAYADYFYLKIGPVCAVTFDGDGGSETKPQEIIGGDTVIEPDTPTREGYTFTGWYLDAAREQLFDFTEPIYTDLVLYAGWEEIPEPTDPEPEDPDGSLEKKLVITPGISEIPDTLKGIERLNTAEKIEAELKTVITQKNTAITEKNTAIYDVTLMVNPGDGWVKADAEHFPENGKLEVLLPYPNGTGKDTHDFTVVHMFTTDDFGKKPGETETPVVTKTDTGLRFEVTGLSPVIVGWTEIAKTEITTPEKPENSDGGDANQNSPDNKQESSAKAKTAVKTGDHSDLYLWIVLFAITGAGIIGAGVYRKMKKKHL